MEQISGTHGVVRTMLGATYAMPGYLLGSYALLMLALGWFAHQRWGEKNPPIIAAHAAPSPAASIATPTPPPSLPPVTTANTAEMPDATTSDTTLLAAPAVAAPVSAQPAPKTQRAIDGQLPPLTYSAHVFTTDPDKRSITLNGVRYREGESPMEGLVIEQIQQDVTLFDVNGDVFILDALTDWPGGDIREAEMR